MKSFKTTAVSSVALCALLAACATKPIYPTDQTTAPTPAPAPTTPPAPPPPPPPPATELQAIPTKPIQSTPLAPPPGASLAPPPTARPAPPPAAAYTPPPPRERAPVMVAQKAPGSGPVKDDTAPPIRVKKGLTLYAISRQTGLDVEELAKLNKLKKPYHLKLGQSIKLPSTRYYAVQNGDTLYAVARRFGVEAKDLAVYNDISSSKALRGGQKIYLPVDAKDKGVPKPIMVARDSSAPEESRTPPPRNYAAPSYTPPPSPPAYTPSPPPVAQATTPSRPTPASPPVATAPPPSSLPPATAAQTGPGSDSDVAAAGRGVFQWPVRGELISTFGPKGATRNDGIDLGATQGDSVRAAAAGEVVYAGNVVQGFGNLVLVKHQGGWVTAYAHLANIEVKMRQQVAQGQEIGVVGTTGGVDRPQLHFEIRYAPTPADKARPIDPMLVLPVQ